MQRPGSVPHPGSRGLQGFGSRGSSPMATASTSVAQAGAGQQSSTAVQSTPAISSSNQLAPPLTPHSIAMLSNGVPAAMAGRIMQQPARKSCPGHSLLPPPVPMPINREAHRPMVTAQPPQPSTSVPPNPIMLTMFDIASLSGLVGDNPDKFHHCFCQAMLSVYRVDQLKAIIRYIRDLYYKQRICIPRSLPTNGRKQTLVDGLVEFVQSSAKPCTLHSAQRNRTAAFNYQVNAAALKACTCYVSDEAARNAAAIAEAAVLKALSDIPNFSRIDGLYSDMEVLALAFLRGNGAVQLLFKMEPHKLALVQSGSFRILLRRFCPHSNKYEVIDNRILIRVNGQHVIVPPQQFDSKKNLEPAVPFDISGWIRAGDQHVFVSSHIVKSVVTVQFVKVLSIADAIEIIKKKDEIPESASYELKVGDDDDVRPSNMLVSLRCPLSMIRMRIPAKATTCNHQQCFDLESAVSYCKQYNKWKCPICCSPIKHDDIRIDSFFKRVLAGAGPDIDQANIGLDGSIQYINPEAERRKQEALEERMLKRRRTADERIAVDFDIGSDPVVVMDGSSFDCPFVID